MTSVLGNYCRSSLGLSYSHLSTAVSGRPVARYPKVTPRRTVKNTIATYTTGPILVYMWKTTLENWPATDICAYPKAQLQSYTSRNKTYSISSYIFTNEYNLMAIVHSISIYLRLQSGIIELWEMIYCLCHEIMLQNAYNAFGLLIKP